MTYGRYSVLWWTTFLCLCLTVTHQLQGLPNCILPSYQVSLRSSRIFTLYVTLPSAVSESTSESEKPLETTWFNRIKTTPERRWDVRAIGAVRSPYVNKVQVPKQATITARNDTLPADGELIIFEEFRECLSDLDGFDYLWAITLMHVNSGFKARIRPMPVADAERKPPALVGLFTSRAPHRPNPIAISALKILAVNVTSGVVSVRGLDLLDDTPILDIKPYVPAFDAFPEARAGWMDMIRSNITEARLKGRFHSS